MLLKGIIVLRLKVLLLDWVWFVFKEELEINFVLELCIGECWISSIILGVYVGKFIKV